jgi:diguanylate cyclase (GGDEF)-like protein
MMIHVADISVITRVLRRKRRPDDIHHEVDLPALLKEILVWANEFVPSEAGSVLIDDPLYKLHPGKEGRLYFLACFGEGSEALSGTSIPDVSGIAGETYHSGRPYLSEDVAKDKKFNFLIDERTHFETRSIICAPIDIEGSIIGVIELINRKSRINYGQKDLALLEIFARYTATFVQNAIDAKKFEELSKRDYLTGLFNARYFFQCVIRDVERMTQNGEALSLILFDLDHFKEVNDTCGHLAGSRVLKEVSQILEEIFLGSNAVMSRYGGDEFVVLLPETDTRKAGELAELIRHRIAHNTFLTERSGIGESPLNLRDVITCSIGVATVRGKHERGKRSEEIAETLMKSADNAMYRAKDLGRDRVCFL